MFLFKNGLSLIINRLSVNSSKNVLFSRFRILKSLQDAEWFLNTKWSATELILGFTLFGKWWYTNMLTNSYIQVSNTFTKIGLVAESILKLLNETMSKIFGNPIFEMKVVT